VTAPRNYFANPVPKGNANDKNQNPWPHVRENTPWLGFPFKSCEITLIRRIKFPLRQNGCTDIVQAGQVGKNTRQDIDEIIELSNFSGATSPSSFILNGKKPQNPSLRLFL
jgi:hypothetical protein